MLVAQTIQYSHFVCLVILASLPLFHFPLRLRAREDLVDRRAAVYSRLHAVFAMSTEAVDFQLRGDISDVEDISRRLLLL
jgi:hypothetical protein